MPVSTKEYLIRKKDLDGAIGWYVKTIDAVEQQQDRRRKTLDDLREQLFRLEKDYYENG